MLAHGLTGDKLGSDIAKCEFFNNGYYEKITGLFDGWENLAPMGLSEKNNGKNVVPSV